MVKIILDTNVIISAILKEKNSLAIIEFVTAGNSVMCLSTEIDREYYNVIRYPKFQKIPDFTDDSVNILQRLSEFAVFYNPFTKFNLIKDLPDNRFLELAAVSSANYLITGNINDFNFASFFETKIITPASYCTEFNLIS